MNKCVDCGKETKNKMLLGELLCDDCIGKTMEKIEKKVVRKRTYEGEY